MWQRSVKKNENQLHEHLSLLLSCLGFCTCSIPANSVGRSNPEEELVVVHWSLGTLVSPVSGLDVQVRLVKYRED